jgi:hypothetical protein
MVSPAISKTIRAISNQLDRDLSREWVFPACARYGELLAAKELAPAIEIGRSEIQSRLRILIDTKSDALAASWQAECKHVTQMVKSQFALNYEELVALLTSLSELAFVRSCLESLGSTDVSFSDPPSAQETREYLIKQAKVYPSRWSLRHTLVLECHEHWWWKSPSGS